ncbi:MAG: hypothetical protein EOM68_26845, partial [Spirochaetia bacterium]|nr:hypothetical protein [Spirochaetia bacterium]
MDTFHHTPIIASFDALVLGSTLAALVTALRLSQEGKSIAIASPHTHLFSDLTKAHRLWITEEEDAAASVSSYLALLFPPSVRATNTKTLHPDKLKLHGEQLCEQHGIVLFYGLMPVGNREGFSFFGGKHGLMGLGCKAFYDLRQSELPSKLDSYGYVMHVVNVPKETEERKFSLPYTSTAEAGTVSCTLHTGTENGHALLAVSLPANTRNEDYVAKDIALACFSYLKKNVPGFRAILPGRFAEKPYPLSYSVKDEIEKGLMATAGSAKASPKEKLQVIPSSLQL